MIYNKIILIPIGGIGSRFKENNYKKPKTLINIFGKPLIFYLLENLIITNETLVYIIYNNEYAKYRFEDLCIKQFPNIIHLNIKYNTYHIFSYWRELHCLNPFVIQFEEMYHTFIVKQVVILI